MSLNFLGRIVLKNRVVKCCIMWYIATKSTCEGVAMSRAVRISDELASEAQKISRVDHRSLAGQIEYWAKLGKCAEENPDLSYTLIKEILTGLEELKHEAKSDYIFAVDQ